VAVAVQIDFKGVTLEQYEQINERIGSLPGGPARQDELFHWVMKTDDGFRVTDVWETQEAFERFERETLRPTYQAVGISHPPKIQTFEVYNYLGQRRSRR